MPREEKTGKGIWFILIMALLSIAAPFFLALAWPPYNLPFLIWIGFAPMYFALKRTSYPAAILLILLSGIVYYTLIINWVVTFHRTFALPFTVIGSTLGSYFPALLLSKPVIEKKPLAGLFIVPAVWVIFEYLKIQGFLGFAFGIVGYGLYDFKEMIQFSEATGVWGVSFLIIAVNYLIFYLVDQIVYEKKKFNEPALFVPTAIVAVILTGAVVFGAVRMGEKAAVSPFEIALVQTNIPEELQWNMDQGLIWAEIEQLLNLVKEYRPAMVILPENTVKTAISMNPMIKGEHIDEIVAKISNMAVEEKSYILIGSGELKAEGTEIQECNSACLFTPDGKFVDSYRKNRLVPFGESFPYGSIFPFMLKILEETGTHMFVPGGDEGKTLSFEYSNTNYPFGAMICFEGTLGYLGAGMVHNGAKFLVNITCDSWANSTAAMEQHAIFGIFRAIENRVSLIRVGNGGVTCLIDPWGRVLNSLGLFESSAAVTKIFLSPRTDMTIYTRFGDWFILAAFLVIAGWGVFLLVRLMGTSNNRRFSAASLLFYHKVEEKKTRK